VGILQEALYWVSSGKSFQVEEITCIAQGDPKCTIAVDKQPLK
jgi:predicted hydrocarbon binding protein